MWEIWVWSLSREDPLEKEMATHSSILAWRIPWTEEPGRLLSMGSQRVGHNWVTSLSALRVHNKAIKKRECWYGVEVNQRHPQFGFKRHAWFNFPSAPLQAQYVAPWTSSSLFTLRIYRLRTSAPVLLTNSHVLPFISIYPKTCLKGTSCTKTSLILSSSGNFLPPLNQHSSTPSCLVSFQQLIRVLLYLCRYPFQYLAELVAIICLMI